MKNLIKFFGLLILILNINQSTNAKPLPPGSGEGDVPANILILLDNSTSMRLRASDGMPEMHSATIIGNGNRVLATPHKNDHGLYLFSSGGQRINFTGTTDSGSSYTIDIWRNNDTTDNTCDNRIGWSSTNEKLTATEKKEETTLKESSKYREVIYKAGVTVGGTDISNENLLFVAQFEESSSNDSKPAIFALNSQYQCRLAIYPRDVKRIRGFHISADADGDMTLAAYGRSLSKNRHAWQMTCNINDGICEQGQAKGKRQSKAYGRFYDGNRLRLNSDSTIMYVTDDEHIFAFSTRVVGSVRVAEDKSYVKLCKTDTGLPGGVSSFDVSSTDGDVLYFSGAGISRKISKVEWTSNTSCTATVLGGNDSVLANSGTAGNLDLDDINITGHTTALNVSDGRILISHGGYVDELIENKFTAADKDTAWQIQYGGPALSRMAGAKQALTAVFTDTTLTSGANFGFGYWNGKTGFSGYYGGWQGNHPNGRSRICDIDSCLQVGISPEGAARAIPFLQSLDRHDRTDAKAWATIAHDYFFDTVSPIDPNSDCQLNYVIVIGDGMMRNTNQAGVLVDRLRTTLKVKTLMVAYGNGIKPEGMALFDEMAVHGSCDAAGGENCEPTIIALTPQDLKTQLQSKIRQILATRLSFTAPSITATIQEGGSLYQAQFSYEQFGEWQGTIIRSSLSADADVTMGDAEEDNWDAAVELKKLAYGGTEDPAEEDGRHIWTQLSEESEDYTQSEWNNVKELNIASLTTEMTRLGFSLINYHSSSSKCGGDDSTDDEAKGLLRFLRGQDFFDYNGDCDTTQLREHVLGDIYHSQLIEVGKPDGSLQFSDINQEAYFRSIKNYQSFKDSQKNRENILYAGSNSGLLHAFNAKTGSEEWAFLPPFIIGKLPTIINDSLDGKVDTFKGGSNAIFGVDGSPVVHDVFIKGLKPDASDVEDTESWRTILFVPFGRGGPGFSVLDVTEPLVKDNGPGPLHMFTVYNDYINNIVYIMDFAGEVKQYSYNTSSSSIDRSKEAVKAFSNRDDAVELDGGLDSGTTTAQDNIAVCQTNTDATTNFRIDGTASCFKGKTFTFDNIFFNTPNNTSIDKKMLTVTEMVDGSFVPVSYTDAKMINGQFSITFTEDKIYNAGGSDNETRLTNNIFIQTSCTGATGIDPFYDYSKLGETWSTPRITRLPSDIEGERNDPAKDKYVAIMGAGMANNNLCAGSALFMVDLSDLNEPGKLYGGDKNGGPITIIDTTPDGYSEGENIIATDNGSDINNAIPTSPVVITPDTAFGIPWRGAMVYVNDREGKITKINLTDSTVNDAKLFDQTTLFRLNANTTNKRYSFFSMDAGVGASTKDFWLFGGTGDFNALGTTSPNMDNILYGIRDFDYPFFQHLNGVVIPAFSADGFLSKAHLGANAAKSIDDATNCADVSEDTTGVLCPGAETAWKIHLGTTGADNTHRKTTAPPTLFKGQVYFPVYEPAPGSNRCNIGNAYVCVADDECGTNNSHKLIKGSEANGRECSFVRQGVLSELVVFSDTLFANVAGPNESAETLYKIPAVAGEVLSNRGGWRDTGY